MIIFALNLAYQEMTVREWIREKEINGTSTFSVEELRSCFIASSEQVIKNELYRLKMQGKILSVYKGFYNCSHTICCQTYCTANILH